MRLSGTNVRRGMLTLGATLLPAASHAQQNVYAIAQGMPCARGGMMLRPSASGGGGMVTAAGSGPRDSLRDRRVEVERMVATRMRAAAVGERLRIDRVRGWLGIHMSELSEMRLAADGRYVRYCDYPVVVSVEPASPAQRAGLEPGDTIVAYNGVDLRSGNEVALDRLLVPADTLHVGVRRGAQSRVFPVVIGRRPESATAQVWSQGSGGGTNVTGQSYSFVLVSPSGGDRPPALTLLPPEAPIAPSATSPGEPPRTRRVVRGRPTAPAAPMAPLAPFAMTLGWGGPSALAGAQIITLDDDLGAVVGAKSGVLVLKVAERTPADEAGLRPGDVIVHAGGRQVTSPMLLQQALLRHIEERTVRLRVLRKGKSRDITLRW